MKDLDLRERIDLKVRLEVACGCGAKGVGSVWVDAATELTREQLAAARARAVTSIADKQGWWLSPFGVWVCPKCKRAAMDALGVAGARGR